MTHEKKGISVSSFTDEHGKLDGITISWGDDVEYGFDGTKVTAILGVEEAMRLALEIIREADDE